MENKKTWKFVRNNITYSSPFKNKKQYDKDNSKIIKLLQENSSFKFDNENYWEFMKKSEYIKKISDISTDKIRAMVDNVHRHREEQVERQNWIKMVTERKFQEKV